MATTDIATPGGRQDALQRTPPSTTVETTEAERLARSENAVLGGGCFWCLEAVYNELRGVESVISGYAGGSVEHPSYEQVCGGRTGHAEVVQIRFDPSVITYRDILDVFFTIHDPTTLNRQGADAGTQYRSIILYASPGQEATARAAIAEVQASGLWHAPIVTQVEALGRFYPAEGYHQNYFERNPYQPYCQIVIAPKVAKARQKYLERLKVPASG
jgi:peptide-methionine (S)-S-oxide reductase